MYDPETGLKINLIEKYTLNGAVDRIRQDFDLKCKPKLRGFKDIHEGLKTGDIIQFIAGYNLDILYTTEILGFDQDGDIYLLWDCYWSPVRLTDPNRKIIVVTPI